jgi:hypothetical protein
MRKLIVTNIVSLDNYYEAPNKNVMPLFDYRHLYPADESFDTYNAERLRAADTLLLGRTSYEGFKGYWPAVADDPKATPAQQEISRLDNAIDKVVISNTLTPAQPPPGSTTPVSSNAPTPTNKSPASSASPAATSSSSAAALSGTTSSIMTSLTNSTSSSAPSS